MTIDDEDLERAGTRSRRQLTNPKPYSMYPPIENTFNHSMNRQSIKQLFNNNAKIIVIACLCLLLLFNTFCKSFIAGNSATITTRVNPLAFEESTEFQDSTQLTDYALLSRLLTEKKGKTKTKKKRK